MPRMTDHTKPWCCEPTCDRDAEWEIWTHRPGPSGGSIAGPDPYSDYTHACSAHVGALCTHQPDAHKPEEIAYLVYPVERAAA